MKKGNNLSIIILILFTAVLLMLELSIAQEAAKEGEMDFEIENFTYSSDDRTDPFIPLLLKEGLMKEEQGPDRKLEMMEKIKQIKVNGVLWDQRMPLVMIDNKIYKKGDILQTGLMVKDIQANSIIFGYYELAHEIFLIEKKNDVQGGINENAK